MQLAEIQLRLDDQEPAFGFRQILLIEEDRLPREHLLAALCGGLGAGGERSQNLLQLIRRVIAVGNLLHRLRQNIKQAAQRLVLGNGSQDRLGRGQLVGQIHQLAKIQIEETVLIEKRSGARGIDAFVQTLPGTQAGVQHLLGLNGGLRGLAVDDNNEAVIELREGRIKIAIGLAERQVGVDHLVGVGVHFEIAADVKRRQAGHNQRTDHEQRRFLDRKAGQISQKIMDYC